MSGALSSVAGTAPLADGVYGVSPTSLQLKYSATQNLSNLIVTASGTNGDTTLNTNFDTGIISSLSAATTYYLGVKGILTNGSQTPNLLAAYTVQTWDVFANSTWTLTAGSNSSSTTAISLAGSSYNVNWTYAPWTTTAPGDGVLAATNMQCFFVPDAGPSTNPFVASAKTIMAPAANLTLPFTAGGVGLSGNVRIGCQINYADGTFSRSPATQMTLLVPAISQCPTTSLNVYTPYACQLTDVLGASAGSSGLSLTLASTNTCTWLSVTSSGITGTPHDPAVGTCTLAYFLTSSSGSTSPTITQTITVNNTTPVWKQLPVAIGPFNEISSNDPGTLTSGALVMSALLTNSTYTVHEKNAFQTNKAAYGLIDNATYGSYNLDSTTSTNCGRLGTYTYPDGNGVQQNGINPVTGEFYFQPYEHVYGSCTVDIFFNDGHPQNNISADISIPVQILGYNDPPQIVDPGFPNTGPSNSELYNCGSNCYVGIDYTVTLQANTGGINPNYPSITGEPDQTLMIKPGNCIAQNSNANDTNVYVTIGYCQLNTSTGNMLVGFTPVKQPPTGETVSIAVVVSDNGARGTAMPSAYNPNNSGTNSTCLANSTSICQSFPNSNRDSNLVAFTLQIAQFSLPIQPALIVSKSACISCHITITSGDFITDIGNTPVGATTSGRFANRFFNNTGDFGNDATHIDGLRSINELAGNLYVKRATLTPANSIFWNAVGGLTSQTPGVTYPNPLSSSSTGSVDLLDFLTSWYWTYNGSRLSDSWVYANNSFASVCGPFASIGDTPTNGKTCSVAPVRDTLTTNGVTSPINYMTISAPTVSDIQAIALASPGAANQINWSATAPSVAPLYIIPTDTNVLPRPFSGLGISNLQPASAVLPGQKPQTALESYITNTGTIYCYGDVVVKGDLFLETPNFVSDSRGCRIHVTGSVLMHAMATNDPNNPAIGDTVTGPGNVGVQITSAVSITMGFTQSEYVLRPAIGMPVGGGQIANNLLVPASTDCITASGAYVSYIPPATETCPTGSAETTDTASYPTGYVGWGRGYVTYSGLMLNAPSVQGRYLGVFQGSVIGDVALFRLGQMQFAFDPRFTGQVPFPRLQTIKSSLGGHARVIFDAGPCTGASTDSWQCDPTATQ